MRKRLAVLALPALALSACASLQPPTAEVQRILGPHLGPTGGQLEVVFALRNPNDDDLLVERFDYDLVLDGRRAGHGYLADPIRLRGHGELRVRSRVELGYLGSPDAMRRWLDRPRVDALAKGHFYVREHGHTRKLPFDSRVRVDLR
ncbi:MAG TPA: LEA type 2 family protein [Vicinamibacteria bacterium]|nr:LEA type 2 family protein [Vicinamibacteria bacterium]